MWNAYELTWRKTLNWYPDARLTLHFPRFAYFTCKIQLSDWDQNQLYKQNQHQNWHGLVEQNCNQYIVIQIIFNQITLCQTLFNMHACQQNPASTKKSYKNNYFFRIKHTEYSFPKQSIENKKSNVMMIYLLFLSRWLIFLFTFPL